jgi:ankyrin repeat protein
VPDSEGSCLLHKAIERGDEFASTFLIKNDAKVNAVTTTEQISPLHLAASYKYVIIASFVSTPFYENASLFTIIYIDLICLANLLLYMFY